MEDGKPTAVPCLGSACLI